jgi:hypothetical protein
MPLFVAMVSEQFGMGADHSGEERKSAIRNPLVTSRSLTDARRNRPAAAAHAAASLSRYYHCRAITT